MWRLELDPQGGPIYAQIARGVERMLAKGQLRPGDRLPSAREWAAELKVNPNTVIHAFAHLEALGLTETRRGLGTYVREDLDVEGLRQRLLREAARRYLEEVEGLGLGAEEAEAALREVRRAR